VGQPEAHNEARPGPEAQWHPQGVAMAIYRFRLIDRHGQLIGAHYLSFDSDAEAIRHALTQQSATTIAGV
jgi:hypothetical protein